MHDPKLAVLEELMEKMKELDGDKIRPKAVGVSVSSEKPELEAIEHGAGGMHAEPDGDELSPEDMAILDSLFGDKSKEEC